MIVPNKHCEAVQQIIPRHIVSKVCVIICKELPCIAFAIEQVMQIRGDCRQDCP